MKKVILNIPHSGTHIPQWAAGNIIIPNKELLPLVDFMTDKDVDRIWEFVPADDKQVATLSRLIVDTERFRNDSREEMFSMGMGLYYTNTPEGKPFRLRTEEEYLRCLEIYDKYHRALEERVAMRLAEYGKCIILDCHSFHDAMNYTEHDTDTFPDICIGVNGSISAEARYIIDIFDSAGYDVKVNSPFSGSLVPIKYLNDARVTSVMIELNRRIYCGPSFDTVRSLCKEIYLGLSEK